VSSPITNAGAGSTGSSNSTEASKPRLLLATVAYFPAYALPAVLGLVSLPLLTRTLGPTQFGIYAVCLTVHGILLTLGADPTSNSLRRLHTPAVATGDADRLTAAGLGLTLTLSASVALAASAVAVGLAAALDLGQWRSALLATAAATAGFTVFQYLITTLYVRERIGATSGAQLAHGVAKALALTGGAVLIGSAAGSLASYAVVLCVLVVWITCRTPVIRRAVVDVTLWRALAGYGVPLIGVSLSWVVLAGLDRFILTLFDGETTAGQYALAYLISDGMISLVAMTLHYAVYPTLVRLWEESSPMDLRRTFEATTDLFVAYAVAAVATLGVAGNSVVGIVGGDEYSVPSVVPVLVGGGLLMYHLAYFEAIGYQLQLKSRTLARQFVMAAAVSVPVTVGCVAVGGQSGAAIATLLSYIVFWALGRRGLDTASLTSYPLERLLKVAGIALLVGLLASPLPHVADIAVVAILQATLGLLVLGRWKLLSGLFTRGHSD
jgi:O-antigen/teichoic acid export membrane protein